MSLQLTLARPYAKAVFANAVETHRLESWFTLLNLFSELIKYKEINRLIVDPKLSDQEIKDFLLDLVRDVEPTATASIKEGVINFIQLLAEGKKLIILPDIALLYNELLSKNKGIVEAEVVSAFPLNQAHLKKIQNKLEARFGSKVKLKVSEDESLLGGVIIRAGNWVMDGSVKSKLIRLSESLKG